MECVLEAFSQGFKVLFLESVKSVVPEKIEKVTTEKITGNVFFCGGGLSVITKRTTPFTSTPLTNLSTPSCSEKLKSPRVFSIPLKPLRRDVEYACLTCNRIQAILSKNRCEGIVNVFLSAQVYIH